MSENQIWIKKPECSLIERNYGLERKFGIDDLYFSGNPGTGKTTVARLIAQIYRSLGVLSRGHLVETDRSGLVAGYVGQTAIKTAEVIKRAMGGVLFIDEAYALAKKGSESDYGQEAIETLLKAMEDNRGDLIVIAAGYTDLMENFLNSNPGLRSRFSKTLFFEDYDGAQLHEIFCKMCRDSCIIIEKFYVGFVARDLLQDVPGFRHDGNGRSERADAGLFS